MVYGRKIKANGKDTVYDYVGCYFYILHLVSELSH